MNVYEEFRRILEERGYDVLVIRRNKQRKCDCRLATTNEIDPSCQKCFGLGYLYIAERHTVRSEDVSVPETLARLTQFTKIGELNTPGRQFFFLPSAEIEEGDIIVDYEERNGELTFLASNIYAINHVDRTKRIAGPTPVYLLAYATDRPLQKELRLEFLSQVKHIQNYSLSFRDPQPVVSTPQTPIQSISIQQNGETVSLVEGAIGNKIPLTAVVFPGGSTNKKLIWSSVNQSIFTVNQQGEITIIGTGIALLGVSSEDGTVVTFIQVKGTP
jgi:hypothetical protein